MEGGQKDVLPWKGKHYLKNSAKQLPITSQKYPINGSKGFTLCFKDPINFLIKAHERIIDWIHLLFPNYIN